MSMVKLQSIENLLKLTETPNTERRQGSICNTDKNNKDLIQIANTSKGIGTDDREILNSSQGSIVLNEKDDPNLKGIFRQKLNIKLPNFH